MYSFKSTFELYIYVYSIYTPNIIYGLSFFFLYILLCPLPTNLLEMPWTEICYRPIEVNHNQSLITIKLTVYTANLVVHVHMLSRIRRFTTDTLQYI